MSVGDKDYRGSHIGKAHGEKYDEQLFSKGSFGNEIWKKEQQILKTIIATYGVERQDLLDFATGTGRIVALLEKEYENATGIDISNNMLIEARKKTAKATFICGDITRNPEIVENTFDCITAFRFFLNAQPSLRSDVLRFLVSKLKNKDSIFIFNIHGNKYSTRWFLVLYDRITGRSRQNQMTMNEIKEMIEPHGLEIVDFYGVGFIYKVFYKFMPKSIWRFFEKAFESISLLKPLSLYFIFVCRRKSPS